MSLKYTGWWARMPDPEAALAQHGPALTRVVEIEDIKRFPGSPYVEIGAGSAPRFSTLAKNQEPLSTLLGEAMLVEMAANVNQLRFARFVSGLLVREWMYNPDHGWCRLSGTPEPWEAEVLFCESALTSLEAFLADCEEPALQTRAREEFDAKVLREGAMMPQVDAVATLDRLRRMYGVDS